MKARVYVTLKSGVLDPQGQAVGRTLARMGYEEVADVRIGKYVELEVKGEDVALVQARVEEMCKKLIANTVIEDFRVEIDASAPVAAPVKKKKK
jgi:phosphoribosylformylglycinamidine synthase